MKIKILFGLLTMMTSCSDFENGAFDRSLDNPTSPNMAKVHDTAIEAPQEAAFDRKLIKHGTLRFETNDLKKKGKSIDQAAKTAGGYIVNEHSINDDWRLLNNLIVRVPADNFDDFIAAISADVEKIDTREIKSQDVTEEFVDLRARITSKKKLEQRYLEILKAAKNVEEILDVEQEAGKVREEIERAEGRLNYLKHQTSMSTVNISFYQVTETLTTTENTFIARIQAGLNNGVMIIQAMIVGLVNIWPLLLLGLGGWFLYRGYTKNAKA